MFVSSLKMISIIVKAYKQMYHDRIVIKYVLNLIHNRLCGSLVQLMYI